MTNMKLINKIVAIMTGSRERRFNNLNSAINEKTDIIIELLVQYCKKFNNWKDFTPTPQQFQVLSGLFGLYIPNYISQAQNGLIIFNEIPNIFNVGINSSNKRFNLIRDCDFILSEDLTEMSESELEERLEILKKEESRIKKILSFLNSTNPVVATELSDEECSVFNDKLLSRVLKMGPTLKDRRLLRIFQNNYINYKNYIEHMKSA